MVETPKAELKKPKKKRNKKQKKVDSDDEFLNQVIKEVTPAFKGKAPVVIGDSVMRMDRQCFNYKRELKTLFASLQGGNT